MRYYTLHAQHACMRVQDLGGGEEILLEPWEFVLYEACVCRNEDGARGATEGTPLF